MATENSEPHRDLSEARMHAVAGIRAYSDAPLYKNFAEHWVTSLSVASLFTGLITGSQWEAQRLGYKHVTTDEHRDGLSSRTPAEAE